MFATAGSAAKCAACDRLGAEQCINYREADFVDVLNRATGGRGEEPHAILVDGEHGKRFVARGAVDDKGQTMMFIEALRAWKDAAGGIPAGITALIEGEEEIGSPNLEPFMAANKA